MSRNKEILSVALEAASKWCAEKSYTLQTVVYVQGFSSGDASAVTFSMSYRDRFSVYKSEHVIVSNGTLLREDGSYNPGMSSGIRDNHNKEDK